MELVVAADDRTGALETAAALADRGVGPVPVSAWSSQPVTDVGPVAVIDLGSRHLTPGEATERAAGLDQQGPVAHKIDSTLRGNWAEELVGRHRAGGRPVLLVPALPELGRTCSGGVVYEHGRPVAEGGAATDVRRRVTGSRPAVTLRAAGASTVVELGGISAVESWFEQPAGIAVADADDDATIESIVSMWRSDKRPVLAGTSAVVGAAAPAPVTQTHAHPTPVRHRVETPVLVACGSVHPTARQQIAAAEQRGAIATMLPDLAAVEALRRGDPVIVATEIPVGDVTEPMAVAATANLTRCVHDLMAAVQIGALLIIGGDTAAAILGERTVVVTGSAAPGTAIVRVDGIDVPMLTRSGGFGTERSLVELLWDELVP